MYPIAPTTQAVFSPPAQTQLKDDFGTSIVTIGALQRLCLPATKTRLDTGQSFPPQNPDAHLICWGITDPNFTPKKVHTTNQFGDAMLDVLAAHSEAAPVAAAEPTPTNVTQPTATLARLSELPLHDSRKCTRRCERRLSSGSSSVTKTSISSHEQRRIVLCIRSSTRGSGMTPSCPVTPARGFVPCRDC